jgi:uncharacterized repeat protein (TIGR02543 family)
MKKIFLLLSVLFVVSCNKEPVMYTLTTSVNPANSGTINPNGGTVDEGQQVSITAAPTAEYVFDKWTGAASGSNKIVSVIMDSDKSVTANFIKKKYTLTTSVEGEGTIIEKVIKAGLATDYNSGTVVELTATPSAEWLFVEWKGDITGTENPKQITIDKAKTVKAVFVKKQYALTIEIEGEGTVAEKVIKAGVATDYNSGTVVELTATPSAEWLFVEWTGDLTGTDNPKQITIDKAKTVKAVFVKKQYALTIEIEGEGTVAEKVIKAGAATDYNSGTVVELTATSKIGWRFKEWTGDLTGTENPEQITIDKAKTVKAVFDNPPPFYLDENEVTVKAFEWVKTGTTGKLNGVTYTAVDNTTLKSMADNDEDVTKVVTTLVNDMSKLFYNNNYFNQNIGSWDTSNVTDMGEMFSGAESFSTDQNGKYVGDILINWDVSMVTNMSYMFNSARSFNMRIGNWDVSSVTNMRQMFSEAISFSQDIGSWDVSNVTDMSRMFQFTNMQGPLNDWDVSNVINMGQMFLKAINFNQDISKWDVSKVEEMGGMFSGTELFNQDISSWDVSSVTVMDHMFWNAIAFNQDIGNWDVSSVTVMDHMFWNAIVFNQDIGNWDVSSVTNMWLMFSFAEKFNQDLTKWCVTNITTEPTPFSNFSALTESNKPIWGTCPGNSYTIAVTASSNADYTFSGEDRSGDVSGNDPNLTFKVGDEVTFSVNAANHPFYLKTAAGTGTGNQISGVTNNGTTNGNVVWTPSEAGTYYYQCSAHSGMVGTITIE